jgi:ubiquinone/menaquinone biosynthesis C-methylase UbiE
MRKLRNALISHLHDSALEASVKRHVRGRLIDIGCGPKPYAKLLQPYVTEHVGVDHIGTLHSKAEVDLWGTAYDIPAPDASFDSALCTAVLEHLEEPEAALRECHRVLSAGGVAIYTVPFIWHLHEEPRDFYRFSKYGLRYLFEKVGFEIVELEALSGFWATFGTLLAYNIQRFNKGWVRRTHVVDVPMVGIQAVAYVMDRLDKAEEWTWMYLVAARKR